MVTLRNSLSLVLLAAILALVGCSREAKINRYRERAQKDFAAGVYATAEVEYKNLLRSAPQDLVAMRQLGAIYLEEGRLPYALFFLSRAHSLEPANIETANKLGSVYIAVRQLNQAEQIALQVLDKQPTNDLALLLLGDAADSAEKIKTVHDRISALQATNSDQPGFHLVLGTLAVREHDLATAQTELEKVIARQPTNSVAYLALGNVYLFKQDITNAGKSFKAASDNAPVRSAARLKYADFKVQTGAVDEGKGLINDIIKQAPDYIPAWTSLMNLAYNSHNYDECAQLVEKVLTRDDKNFEALVTDGRVKLARGELDKAIQAFEKAANIYERVPMILHQLGLAYLYKGDTGKAVQNFNSAVAADLSYAPSVLALAEMSMAKGDFGAATTSLNQLIQRRPELEQPYLLVAQAHLQQKQYDEAAALYRRVIELFPKNPEPYHFLGSVLVVQKKTDEARAAFEKALSINPNYLQALEQLIDLDIAQKNYSGALALAQKHDDPKNPSATVQLYFAKIHAAANDFTSAEKDLLKAIELAPNNNRPYILLSRLYVETHKEQEALDRLGKFVSRTNDVPALTQIGMIQQSMTNYPAARDTYEKILTVQPKSSLALNNLAYLYSEKLNDLDKAQKLAERARDVSRDDPATADTLGWVYYKTGDYARARALITEAAQKLGGDLEVEYHLGLTHYMLGEEAAARSALERVVKSDARPELIDDAQHHLAVLNGTDASGKALSRETLEKVAAANPNDPVVLDHLAASYEAEGATDKAIALYQRSLKANRKNPPVLLKLAQYYAHAGNDSAQALGLAKEAHNLAPYDVQVNRLLGRLAFDAGDYTWSVSLLQEAARSLPPNGDLNYDLAWAYYNTGKLNDAETTMRSALQTGTASKDDATRFLALLDAYNNPGRNASVDASDAKYVPALMVTAARQPDKARAVYEQILAKNPLFVPASRDLAVLLTHENSDDAKAYALAVKAREAFPDDADVARSLGILSYRKGEYRRAVELLKEAQQKRAEDGESCFYLGMAYYKLNQPDVAKTALKEALDHKLDQKLSDEATKLLAELK